VQFGLFAVYRPISKQRARLDLVLGGGPTLEQYTGEEGTSLGEAKAGFAASGRPNKDTDIDLSVYVYPAMSGSDRIRVESDLTFQVEIIHDLTFDITAYYRFNSEPPEGVEESDFGITFGVGAKFD